MDNWQRLSTSSQFSVTDSHGLSLTVSKKSIYIAYHHETSNALNASVHCEQKRLQRLFETAPANNRIPQAVRQGIPDRHNSHIESPSAIGAELVTRYDYELLGGGSKMLPWCDWLAQFHEVRSHIVWVTVCNCRRFSANRLWICTIFNRESHGKLVLKKKGLSLVKAMD